eukprot:SAG31_NODE_1283_length_9011_cov_2.475202_3_plen_143_part_00
MLAPHTGKCSHAKCSKAHAMFVRVGFLDAIMIVISSIISPVVGRLSDLHGRLPWYFTGLAINICSLLFVAARGSNMSLQTIICFSVLRGLAGATRTIIRAIMSEEFGKHASLHLFRSAMTLCCCQMTWKLQLHFQGRLLWGC